MSQPIKHFYEFGPFRVDTRRRILLRGEQVVPLSTTLFDLLLALLESGGHLLDKDELMQRLWPDSFVEEGNLARNVSRLRAALGESHSDHLYIETVPKRGYRFVADVREVSENGAEAATGESNRSQIVMAQDQVPGAGEEAAEFTRAVEAKAQAADPAGRTIGVPARQRASALVVTVLAALAAAALLYTLWLRNQPATDQPAITSLAVLPLKSLNREGNDDYLGLGLADTIITRVSQVDGLTVRPTSAVRMYADQDIDALEAARQLQADAVPDGTLLHAGDRLRVSVNLLRVRDGVSLWADSFDMRFTDIFAIQDQVSKEVATRLHLKLSPAQQARLTKHQTSNPAAYSYYTKAMYHFSNRDPAAQSRGESDQAIELFKKAIELDPNYALAHAQLGHTFAWTASVFEDNPALVELARLELETAERLDPQLAEVHVARFFIIWSQYGGCQAEAGIRELRLAQELDPNVGHFELAMIYARIGLDEEHEKEMELAMEIDPSSNYNKRVRASQYYFRAMPDEGLAAEQRHFNRGPGTSYYLGKRMLKEAEQLIAQKYQEESVRTGSERALLLALQGKPQEAEAAIPAVLAETRKTLRRSYHHFTYDSARIYALGDKSEEAIKWLRETAQEGMPNYTLFLRDPFLDPIRKDPAFIQFMAEMKARWEAYRREFE